jgi:hypothetical protein
MDLTDHQVNGLSRGHNADANAFRRLRKIARTRIAVTTPAAAATGTTIPVSSSTSPLRAELASPATTTTTRLTPVVPSIIAPVIPASTIVAVPTLAGSFVVTGLR